MATGTQNVRNIIIGAASVYLSKSDSTAWTTPPALPAVTGTASIRPALDNAATDWRDVGFTQEGVEVAYAPDYGDVEVDQLLDSARLFKQSMRVTVNTTFAEATLENLLVVWGQATSTLDASAPAQSVLSIVGGSLGDEPVERAITFVGNAPRAATGGNKRERVYYVTRAIQTESTSHALRRNEVTGLPVSFRILPDPGQSNSRYGTVTDRNIT